METGERGKGMMGEVYKKKKGIKQVRDYGKMKGSDPDPVCPN